MSAAGQPAAAVRGAGVKRKILKGSAWVFAGRMASIVLGVAVNALLARLLSRDELGGYFVATSIMSIGSTIACLGLNKTIVRMIASSLALNKPGRAGDAMRITFAVGTSSGLLIAVFLILGPGRAIALHQFNSPIVADAMPYVAGWLAAMTLQLLVAETFRGFKRFISATLFSGLIVDIFSVAIFGMLWVRDESTSLTQVLLILLSLTAVTSLIGMIRLLSKLPRLRGRGVIGVGEMMRVSLPLLVVGLSSFFVGTGVDLWVVARFQPLDQVALYGAAAKLMFVVSTPLIIVSQVVPPIIAQLYSQNRRDELEHALRATATLAGIPAAAALLMLMAAGGWVLELVYGSGFYSQAWLVLVILGCSRLFAVYTGSCGVALTMTGHQTLMMRITLVTAMISLALELAFVVPFGIVGVAVATLIAQILQNLAQLIATHRTIGIWTHAEFSLKPILEWRGR